VEILLQAVPRDGVKKKRERIYKTNIPWEWLQLERSLCWGFFQWLTIGQKGKEK
jgi:hypothetical protein